MRKKQASLTTFQEMLAKEYPVKKNRELTGEDNRY
jgi:hypothetical protein